MYIGYFTCNVEYPTLKGNECDYDIHLINNNGTFPQNATGGPLPLLLSFTASVMKTSGYLHE